MGSAPYLGGGFGHFYAYAPTKIEYAIDRFAMEAKRQFDVLDRRLAEAPYLAGDDYSIADIATWCWYGNVQGWAAAIAERPAVKRGRMVNRVNGDLTEQLHERHDANDFDLRTQDK